ncbi:MAG: hypothetical protein KY461_00495 [Actinobacteria bacterium]|nr:hypothetical protein [Actinomycetota bacterium]
MDATETTCPRHPDTATRLSCTQCGTPICPRCAIDAPVGQKCPDCVRQHRAAVAKGKPRQYRKGAAAGAAAAVLAGVVLPIVLGISFVGLIATGFLGYGIAHAVLWGAEGNRAETFRNLALGFALVMVAGAFTVRFGTPVPGGLRGVLVYAAAAYGAYARFNR